MNPNAALLTAKTAPRNPGDGPNIAAFWLTIIAAFSLILSVHADPPLKRDYNADMARVKSEIISLMMSYNVTLSGEAEHLLTFAASLPRVIIQTTNGKKTGREVGAIDATLIVRFTVVEQDGKTRVEAFSTVSPSEPVDQQQQRKMSQDYGERWLTQFVFVPLDAKLNRNSPVPSASPQSPGTH